jgi:hypothetical protein
MMMMMMMHCNHCHFELVHQVVENENEISIWTPFLKTETCEFLWLQYQIWFDVFQYIITHNRIQIHIKIWRKYTRRHVNMCEMTCHVKYYEYQRINIKAPSYVGCTNQYWSTVLSNWYQLAIN